MRRKLKYIMAFLLAIILLFNGFIVRNTLQMKDDVSSRTGSYMEDTVIALAESLDSKLNNIFMVLSSIGDSLGRIDTYSGDEFEDYLSRKSAFGGFLSMHVVSPSGAVFPESEYDDDFFSLEGVQQSLAGKPGESMLGNSDMVYSIPLEQDGEIIGALCGVRDENDMRSMLNTHSFDGLSHNAMVSIDNSMQITTEHKAFHEVSLFFENADGAGYVNQVLEDFAEYRPGVISFPATDGSVMLLAYHRLEQHSDWVMFTFLPDDAISADINHRVNQTFLITGGAVLLIIGMILMLVIENRRYMRHITRTFYVDELTGGMSISAFHFQCDKIISHSPPSTYSILLLNISKFKLINAQFGPDVGNEVLKCVMGVMDHTVKDFGFAAHGYADIFYACVKASTPSQIIDIAEHIQRDVHATLSQFNQNREHKLSLDVCMGAFIVDDPQLDIHTMQDRARMACRSRDVVSDSICVIFDDALLDKLKDEHDLLSSFENALDNGEFKVYYQPKIKTANKGIGGAEALVRWEHPVRGLIPPDTFIPLLERVGKLIVLDYWVFEEACKMLRNWLDAGNAPLPLSVNMSGLHFLQENCVERYGAIVRQYQIPKGLLELELTETIFLDDFDLDKINCIIQGMHENGIRCSLDDFGSGFSSMSMLMKIDIDALKLDRSMFFNWDDERTRTMVYAILAACRNFHVDTVAEGIETEDMVDVLRDYGCDLIQGYVYAKPMPFDEFESWVKHRSLPSDAQT